jgi:two-component system NtrC family sensor kinase
MKTPFPITFKLLFFILPLVCLPVLIVGYFSYHDSIESVTALSREQQLLRAEAVAGQINKIFQSCFMDLKLMTELLVVRNDVGGKRTAQIKKGTVFDNEKILKTFLERSPYYTRIEMLDPDGHEVAVACEKEAEQCNDEGTLPLEDRTIDQIKQGTSVTEVMALPFRKGYHLYFSRPLNGPTGESTGKVVLDFDYGKVLELVRSVVIGIEGYAFMVDHLGRTVGHPRFRPYEYNLSKYSDPRLREFVVNMICGETGWKRYNYLGEKAAAYAPIRVMDWSVAVSIPIEEFTKEAKSLRKQMIEVVIVTLLMAAFVLVILSYNLLRPIKRLAAATERIADGDLEQEIPVNSSDEMGMLTLSFNRMMENLKKMRDELVRSEKLIAMGKLSAGVAHEIRNPLNAMKGAIVYLRRRRPEDELILEYTQLILEEVERLNRFVTEFLSYACQPPPRMTPEDLNDLIRKAIALFEEELREKEIILVKDLDPDLPMLPMDSSQIGQVLANLLINAMDAMPEGGTLEIKTRTFRGTESQDSPGRVVMTMRDNGFGISKDDLKGIFDPFFSTKENGAGLGLPISLRIVENHGGAFTIESREGEGTTLTLELTTQ